MRKSFPALLLLLVAAVAVGLQLPPRGQTPQDASVDTALLINRFHLLSHSSSSGKSKIQQLATARKDQRITNINARKRPDPRVLHGGTGTVVPATFADLKETGCGDGLIIGKEQCDDGNPQKSDGCSETCQVEAGYQCGTSQPSHCWTVCGDGSVAAVEKCDDGNMADGDGCTECRIDVGYNCSGSPSVCSPIYNISSASSSSSS